MGSSSGLITIVVITLFIILVPSIVHPSVRRKPKANAKQIELCTSMLTAGYAPASSSIPDRIRTLRDLLKSRFGSAFGRIYEDMLTMTYIIKDGGENHDTVEAYLSKTSEKVVVSMPLFLQLLQLEVLSKELEK